MAVVFFVVIANGFAADAGNDELIARMKELDADFAARVASAEAEGGVLRYIGRIERSEEHTSELSHTDISRMPSSA